MTRIGEIVELLHGAWLMVVVEHRPEKPEVTSPVVVLSNLVDEILVGKFPMNNMHVGEKP